MPPKYQPANYHILYIFPVSNSMLVISTPFWITLIFGVIFLVSIYAITTLILRNNRLLKELYNKTQEENILIGQLETAAGEVEQSKDALHQNNLLKDHLAAIVVHDLESPLRFLAVGLKKLNDEITKAKLTEMKALSEEVQRTSTNIYGFVEDFATWLGTLEKKFSLNNRWFNMYDLINDLHTFFAPLTKDKNNSLVIKIDKLFNIYSDAQLLKIILRNIIDNANKHTSNGTITIAMHTSGTTASIVVYDNGEGMKTFRLEKLQQQINSQGHYTFDEQQNSRGYGFIIDFCRLLDLSLSVESLPGKGTKVTVQGLQSEVLPGLVTAGDRRPAL